ncbi:telomere repeat binding factor-like DNA-binding domain-containing protein [Encephalitozoon hellem]|uniref:SANT/myb-like domain-containing protein n=1 Tax=Encephalitozoon hellem TaxID=27973 RepID=A0A9Q9CAL3_ENCHE|nr:uncharacterized protein EHEL_010630 [Encephalitozoon hellem ATCC 50504]AFM97687.1 hypothetical protein EHEL_010630 [Encephalitozoon hellem ATCC 50504]KAG5858907.1 telomere repeat binding factor-like DNA-binding domain-containing protein [Encephalitozoon hellem]UTX42378.1 SANT/myb-like domain-containing protein [Encephalitozoon hellem]WEL37820.1 SANT/myb-like domain-containing protein [Encephalitozoon hellem]|eukprot:XP_003886668.1 hypothetical protein EHEL_010630 [Encephalitozoon hellem ATCC 50504]
MEEAEYNGPSSKLKLHIYSKVPKKKHVRENIVVRSYTKNPRRKPKPWSPEEEEALLKGIKELGHGKWKEILEKYKNIFHECRRHIDLSDKIRVMNKKASYYYTTKINFIEVNDEGEEVSNALGERRVYPSKFPYSAAKKAGLYRLSSGVKEAVINIQGERNGVIVRHKYHVSVSPESRTGINLVKIGSETIEKAAQPKKTHEALSTEE